MLKLDKKKLLEIKNKSPLFIVGCQRSGTSFLYRSLANVLDIGFGRDNTLFLNLYESIARYGDLTHEASLRKLLVDIESSNDYQKRFKGLRINYDDFISLLETRNYHDIVRTIYACWALKNGKSRWGGKTPDYTEYIDLLIRFFPDVKIIHLVRDGRDVALSLFSLPWGPKDAYMAANYWKKRVVNGSAGKNQSDKKFFEMRYEDLLETPEKIFEQLLKFLAYEDINLQRKIWQFRQEIIPQIRRNNKHKWKEKMSKRDIYVFELTAGEQLEKYGYEIVNKGHRSQELSFISKSYHFGKNILMKGIKGHLFRNSYERVKKEILNAIRNSKLIPKTKAPMTKTIKTEIVLNI